MSRAATQTPPTPLPPASFELLQDLRTTLSSSELMWASGFLAGMAQSSVVSNKPATDTSTQTTVIYATETGNSRRIAEALVDHLAAEGNAARALDARDLKLPQLKKESRVVVVAATHGLGDAPEGSEDFFDALHSDRAPRLEHLEFAVLGLGDSSYDDFCQVGIDTDQRLEALGAKRFAPRVDCDLDYESAVDAWTQRIASHVNADDSVRAAPHLRPVPSLSYGPKHPFDAAVLTNQRITGPGSSKAVHHIELSIEGSGLTYEPGDALGVVIDNPASVVEPLLETLSASGDETVQIDDQTLTLNEALRTHLDVTASHRAFAQHYATAAQQADLSQLLETSDATREFFFKHQIVDLLRAFPGQITPQQLVDGLRKRQPRLYSIASSLDANPDEAHLTVAQVRYDAFGRTHFGSASAGLVDHPESVKVYVEPNPHFRLPENADAPIIMIGPGTGIAPFRAFLEHRAEHGATGKNWLFFGDRTLRQDFLYQLELQRRLRNGTLTRLDVAFSRDQAQKIYVQQRLRENASDVFAWLEAGAHLYVCGDSERMAPDVHEALRQIIADEGGMNSEAAENYLRGLKAERRYQRDVY
jgi:sulfite reductase (NADPH) flavoprotein alpha-component